jgi:hypothetical protein
MIEFKYHKKKKGVWVGTNALPHHHRTREASEVCEYWFKNTRFCDYEGCTELADVEEHYCIQHRALMDIGASIALG